MVKTLVLSHKGEECLQGFPASSLKATAAEAPEKDLDWGLRKTDLGMRAGGGGSANVQRA